MRNPRIVSLPVLALVAWVASACDGESSPTELQPAPPALAQHVSEDDGHALGAAVLGDLAALRAATAAFHNIDKAMAAGWDAAITPCLSSPDGGMGAHMANLSRFDELVETTVPETLVYEPQKNGKMRLVAVEFIVPFDAHPADADPPEAFGRHFHANHEVGIWALHLWAWRHNPNGMFADWNPNVTCDWAD